MSESNSNVIPAINAVDGFNPADFVRTTVGEEGENDLYLDVKYRLLWFRLTIRMERSPRSLSELMRRMQSYAAGSMPIRLTQLTSSLGRRILSVSQRKTALAIASWRSPKQSQRAALWLMQVMVRSSV